MTTDSPKGPESEAELRTRVAEHFRVKWGYAEMNELLRRCAGDALEALWPELERLTAEVQAQNRLYRRVGSERDERQFEVERLRRVESRLREQLATAVVLPKDARHRIWSVLFLCAREGDTANDTAVAVLNLLRSWGVSSSEVEAPEEEEEERATPRWREGDIAIDQTNFVHRRFGHGWRTWPRESGLQYGDALMESGFGPMLRLDEVPAETDAHGHVPLLVAERVRAAQAARSGATTKVWRDRDGDLWNELPNGDMELFQTSEGIVIPLADRQRAGSRASVEAQLGLLVRVPSPSLRKEGEDR